MGVYMCFCKCIGISFVVLVVVSLLSLCNVYCACVMCIVQCVLCCVCLSRCTKMVQSGPVVRTFVLFLVCVYVYILFFIGGGGGL